MQGEVRLIQESRLGILFCLDPLRANQKKITVRREKWLIIIHLGSHIKF